MADPQSSPLPVFYRNPVPLDRVRHAKLGFVRPKDHGFARGVNSVPIAAIEFQSAARNYPIVFTNTDPAGAVAVLGFEAGQNLFLESSDRWADDCYVPAYVRRYPFVFTRTPAGEFVLCMEEAPGLLAEGGEAIFGADGKPSKMIEEVLRFAGDFQLQIDVVQHFVRACIAAGVLVENRASIQMPDKRAVTLQGFRTIDTKRFEALPEATVAEWWRKGWLMLAYQHLMSLGNWQLLANRASKIANAAKAAKG
jgi:hypothetical protein